MHTTQHIFFRPVSDHFQRIDFRQNGLKNSLLNALDRFKTERNSSINIYPNTIQNNPGLDCSYPNL